MKTLSAGKKISFGFILLLLITGSLILAGCGSGGGGGGGTAGTTSVLLNLDIPTASQLSSASPQSNLAAAAGAAPVLVYSLRIQISGAGMATMTDIFNVTPGTTMTKVYNVPTGNSRTFTVSAYDGTMGTGTLLYEGTTTANLGGGSIGIDIPMILADIADALRALSDGKVVGANDLFRAAVDKHRHDSDGSASKDTAHFFYALTRIMTLWFDMQSDGVNDGINDAGDILDAFDCSQDRDPNNLDINFGTESTDPFFTGTNCPGPGYPSGGDLQNFAYNTVRAELVGAVVENLDKVSETFKATWTEPFGSAVVESDYGDVYVLKAMFKAAIASLEIQQAYNLDVDLNPFIDTTTIEDFLRDNPGFLTLLSSGGSNLAEARNYLNEALFDIEEGISWIQDEADSGTGQENDWLNMVGETEADIADIRDDIAMARRCLAGTGTCVTEDNKTPGDSDDDIVDVTKFFDGSAANLRSYFPQDPNDVYPAGFNGDDPVGFLPDPTFGGILIQVDGYNNLSVMNDDNDDDGTADSLDKDIYYVYGGNNDPSVSHGISPWSKEFRTNPELYGYNYLGAASGADGIKNFPGPYIYYFIKFEIITDDLLDFVDNEVYIDELQFMGDDSFCCDNDSSFYSGREWWVFNGFRNPMNIRYEKWDSFFLQSPVETTGLIVWGMAP